MLTRCKLHQWWGFTPEEQAWMAGESERGRPTYIALGHTSHALWWVERPDRRVKPGDVLLQIKWETYPWRDEGKE